MESIENFFEEVFIFADNKLEDILKNVSEEECDRILDRRDGVIFSDNWMRVYDEVNEQMKKLDVNPDYIKKIEILRERVFKRVYNFTTSSDLAAYISDDIELILKATLVNYNNNWLDNFWFEYKNGQPPL